MESLQAKLLNQKFNNGGYDSVILREPGGSEISEKIRKILLDSHSQKLSYKTEALLMTASRAQLVDEIIKAKLKEDSINDRY